MGDFNGDGRLDMAVTDSGTNNISVFLQPSPVPPSFALLNGGNSFTGNQSINGTVNASLFIGDGSGLMNVAATNLNCAGCVTNTMLANPLVSVLTSSGSGLAGGGPVALGGRLALFVDSTVPRVNLANTFTASQTMPGLAVNGTGISSASNGTAVVGINTGNSAGDGVFGSSSGGPGIEGFSANSAGVLARTQSASSVTAAADFNNVASTNTGNIIIGRYNNGVQFTVDAKGNVIANGNVAAAGTITIGTGGTPIAEYVSTTYNATLPALSAGSCTTFTTTALTGFTPGPSDTIALGLSKSLVSSLGNNIFLLYQAWETTTSTSPTLTIQVCNPTGARYAGGATGTIRMDILKH